MSEASDSIDALNASLALTATHLTSIRSLASSATQSLRSLSAGGFSGGTGGGMGGGTGGGGGYSSNSLYGGAGGLNDPFNLKGPDYTDPTVRSSMTQVLTGLAFSGVGAMASFLPSTQEAVYSEAFANRLRFYGAAGTNTTNSRGASTLSGAYKMTNQLAQLGTSTSAMDAAIAANSGAGMGLLPGLSNYSPTAGYGGVLGGAALASNLTPGLGLTGGMQAMAGLNQARRVNLLNMIGVNVRNANGTGMNNLPDIIGQIYKLLEQSAGTGNVTAAAIAVSAMSGNALDSILNQYFGGDAALRQTVISGLVQMANSKGTSLRTSGSQNNLMKTGGMSSANASLAQTNAAELNMIQNYSTAVNKGLIMGNKGIQGIFGTLDSMNAKTGTVGDLTRGAATGLAALNTFAGARGGAGAMLTDAAFTTGSFAIGGVNKLLGTHTAAKVGLGALGVLAGGAAASRLGNFDPNVATSVDIATPSLPATAAAPSPTFTGAITINVTAPPGNDPWAWGSTVTQAMIDAAKKGT